MRRRSLVCLAFAAFTLSCSTMTEPAPPTVYFSLDAPFCGLTFPMHQSATMMLPFYCS